MGKEKLQIYLEKKKKTSSGESMLVVLSGGTGGVKLIQGLKEVYPEEKLAIIANTADDKWLAHGYFSPDIDSILYALSNEINEETWYGIKNDSFLTHERLLKLGYDEFLKIGDIDRAMHIQRGALLKKMKLCEVIELQRKALGIKAKVIPMSDDKVTTCIETPQGILNLQEFLVKFKALPEVKKVFYEGIDKAKACEKAIEVIKKAKGIIIAPSNPITSILPIISLKEIKNELTKKRNKCIAVSPIIKGKAISGPLEKFLRAEKLEASVCDVAKLYKHFASKVVIDTEEDELTTRKIKALDMEVFKTSIIMREKEDKIKLAKFLLEALGA